MRKKTVDNVVWQAVCRERYARVNHRNAAGSTSAFAVHESHSVKDARTVRSSWRGRLISLRGRRECLRHFPWQPCHLKESSIRLCVCEVKRMTKNRTIVLCADSQNAF